MSGMSADPNCIFCKIVAGQIPSFKLLEDEATIAFMAPVRRDLCQDTDPRARSNNPVTPETPAPYTCNGLARTSVCRRHRTAPPILISQ